MSKHIGMNTNVFSFTYVYFIIQNINRFVKFIKHFLEQKRKECSYNKTDIFMTAIWVVLLSHILVSDLCHQNYLTICTLLIELCFTLETLLKKIDISNYTSRLDASMLDSKTYAIWSRPISSINFHHVTLAGTIHLNLYISQQKIANDVDNTLKGIPDRGLLPFTNTLEFEFQLS